jgi:hypothetical protein
MSQHDTGQELLRESPAVDFIGLITRFRPFRAGRSQPAGSIAILLFASLLNVWNRFSSGGGYVEWIYEVVPNVVLPLCAAERFPYDGLSYVSAMESVALAFAQAVSAVPAIAMTFTDPRVATRLLQMRDDREAHAEQRCAELARLRSDGMRAIEELAQLRADLAGSVASGGELAGELTRQRESHIARLSAARAEIDEKDAAIRELERRDAGRADRTADLEERIRALAVVAEDRRAEVGARERAVAEKKERIAEIEARLARISGRASAAGNAWARAVARLRERPSADAALVAIFTETNTASAS